MPVRILSIVVLVVIGWITVIDGIGLIVVTANRIVGLITSNVALVKPVITVAFV